MTTYHKDQKVYVCNQIRKGGGRVEGTVESVRRKLFTVRSGPNNNQVRDFRLDDGQTADGFYWVLTLDEAARQDRWGLAKRTLRCLGLTMEPFSKLSLETVEAMIQVAAGDTGTAEDTGLERPR
jgi:hypothetical protein